MQVTVSQYVNIDVDLDDIDLDDLAKAIVSRNGYIEALDKALMGKKVQSKEHLGEIVVERDHVRELIDCFRSGKPVEPIISQIAYSRYGLIC